MFEKLTDLKKDAKGSISCDEYNIMH